MVGKKINNYELRELVGDGAMGVVYLAEHPVLRRRVAVKLLKRQYLESPSLVTRFVNEARAAAAIHHPNVIEVIDVGMVDDDVPYIMMEFLDGEPLSRRLTRERLGVGKAVDIAIQAARAVAASHALEIVHRDLKPENLFLVPDPMSPGGERVKVLDFGIAKLRPDWSGSDGAKTRTGVIFGTPAYMSPEQCRGLNDEVDGATDIYALGCILFEMLCRACAVRVARVGRRPDDAHVGRHSGAERGEPTRAGPRSTRSCARRSRRRRPIASRACGTCTARSRRRATTWRTRRRRCSRPTRCCRPS